MPAFGYVQGMDLGSVGKRRDRVARVLAPAPGLRRARRERLARQERDAVVARLAVYMLMLEAERAHRIVREVRIGDLRFLKAKHVRPVRLDQTRHMVEALADRIHVPRGDAQGHEADRYRTWQGRQVNADTEAERLKRNARSGGIRAFHAPKSGGRKAGDSALPLGRSPVERRLVNENLIAISTDAIPQLFVCNSGEDNRRICPQ